MHSHTRHMPDRAVQMAAVLLLAGAAWAGQTLKGDGPVHDLLRKYDAAFDRGQFLRVAGCFTDSYFKGLDTKPAYYAAKLGALYPKEGRFNIWILDAKVEYAAAAPEDRKASSPGDAMRSVPQLRDGPPSSGDTKSAASRPWFMSPRAKGHILYQLTGKRMVTEFDGRRWRVLRYTFHRADFEARPSQHGWRFTKFDVQPSEDARQIKIGQLKARLAKFMANPKRTPAQTARCLGDVSFMYYLYEQYPQAEHAARDSLAAAETAYGHGNLAHALLKQGRYDEAIAHFRKAASAPDCSAPLTLYRRRIRECKVRKEREMKGQ